MDPRVRYREITMNRNPTNASMMLMLMPALVLGGMLGVGCGAPYDPPCVSNGDCPSNRCEKGICASAEDVVDTTPNADAGSDNDTSNPDTSSGPDASPEPDAAFDGGADVGPDADPNEETGVVDAVDPDPTNCREGETQVQNFYLHDGKLREFKGFDVAVDTGSITINGVDVRIGCFPMVVGDCATYVRDLPGELTRTDPEAVFCACHTAGGFVRTDTSEPHPNRGGLKCVPAGAAEGERRWTAEG